MENFNFKYGSDAINFSLPKENLLGILKMAELTPIENPKEAILNALRNPIDSKPLKNLLFSKKTVAIIVNDETRVANTSFFLPIILDELNSADIPDENIFIVFALGTHRPMTQEEMEREVGIDTAKRVKMYNPDCNNISEFKYFGDTSFGTPVRFYKKIVEADYTIATGSVVHHFFAGFGGGRKAVFPGVSHYETISKNHSLMFHENSVAGKLHGNPVYDDQIEGTKMFPPTFLLNTVLNEKKEFLGIFAGNYITAHLKACELVDKAYGIKVNKEADLVIATCGGYPKDINVYQLQKTMDNAVKAVKEGGVVIIMGECKEGSGSKAYEELMQRCDTPDKVEKEVRANFKIGAHKAYSVTRLMKKATFILISKMDKKLVELLLFKHAENFDEAFIKAKKITGENPSIYLMPQGSLTLPLYEK